MNLRQRVFYLKLHQAVDEQMGMILIAALGQEEKTVGPDLVAVRLQVLGAVRMLTGSYLGLISLRVPHDGYSIVFLDPVIDLEATTASLRSGLLVHPAHSGDRMVWVGVISRRLANAGNAYAHDGEGDQDNRRLLCARCK